MLSCQVTQKSVSFLLGVICLLTLSGCGEGLTATSTPPGVFIDSTTEQFLRKAFEETKACAELSEGKFEEISVILMPPVFPCPHYPNGCSGEYVAPNSVKVGSLSIWRHEVLHYLLHLNTSDPDSSHQSPLFKQCA